MNFIKIMSIGLLVLAASPWAMGASEIRFKTGEMELLAFLENASDQLDIQIDATTLGNTSGGKVTIPDLGPIDSNRAQALILTTLHSIDYTWIHDRLTDVYRIRKIRDARDEEIPFITDPQALPDTDQLVTFFIPLKHVPAEAMARILRSFMPGTSRVIPEESTRSLLLSDAARAMSKYRAIAGRLDTPQSAEDAKEELKARAKKAEAACSPVAGPVPANPLITVLFVLISLVIGFMFRGYVIRRIEGGL